MRATAARAAAGTTGITRSPAVGSVVRALFLHVVSRTAAEGLSAEAARCPAAGLKYGNTGHGADASV